MSRPDGSWESTGQDYTFDLINVDGGRYTVSGTVYIEEDYPFEYYGCEAILGTVKFTRIDRNEVDGLTAFDNIPTSLFTFDELQAMRAEVCDFLNNKDGGNFLHNWFQENVIDAYK